LFPKKNMTAVIGLMSGTSVDGIDAVLVEITGQEFDLKIKLLNASTYPYPATLREQILAVCAGDRLSMAEFATLDDAIAQVFAEAAIAIQRDQPLAKLIGSHGQTIYHRPPTTPIHWKQLNGLSPNIPLGYSLQIGRGAFIAYLTGLETVSNFRVGDIAGGGQGAPLVTKVDACVLTHLTKYRCIQNLGGIGNVTYLPPKIKKIGRHKSKDGIRGREIV
jgi:anhydro-N-acetylmuramic acid kinase